jgi:Lectin C-type domain/PEP-CTERM motif
MNTKLTFSMIILLAISKAASASPVQLGTTGEYFEYISTNESWNSAKADASTAVFNGTHGHLAVILNAAENSFVTSLINNGGGHSAWLGATNIFDSAHSQEDWTWLTGQTWVTSLSGNFNTPGVYTNWSAGEPNNAVSAANGFHEDALQIYANGTWNDLGGNDYHYQNPGYIIEYNVFKVPEPASILLLVAGALGFGASRKKR